MKVAFAEFRDNKLYDCQDGKVVELANDVQMVFMNPFVVYFIPENETKQEELKFITDWISQRYSTTLPKICDLQTVFEKLTKQKSLLVYGF